MINDRGAKKWSAMMLPEHVKMLREWEDHLMNAEEKPEVADQKLEQFDEAIQTSLHENLDVNVTYYNHSSRKRETFTGEVRKVDPVERKIKFITDTGFTKFIKIEDIVDIFLN
ncbi:2C-methyl-D-erythritol 2,4-cyclodiphosphate synthase [Pullulanibacillus pueri]|uniref:YolD-like family protein n=1 Tax=Pullulanibacillus pueri TaxID=1437324 RepID=A0A8J2ZV83_9BACL|nr:YolD-like family protein [Pullulanibacillus pueri]MBM7682255.1 2C-methyl-D-erythritol 2,4-cyclodiphosphate synthase [Pullulanibacillus pueri]GGH81070.1 hypothetical protein GCM10007096_18420 [Pullulanibacillus pueri]